MVTSIESSSDAPSESLTVTLTVELAGPSGNEQTKLPAPVVGLKRSAPTCVPLAPQSVAPSTKVSWPGSLTVKPYEWPLPSLAVAGPVRVTVGATLSTVTVWVSSLLSSPSESSTWTETVLEAGPSGNEQTKLPAPVVVLKVSG